MAVGIAFVGLSLVPRATIALAAVPPSSTSQPAASASLYSTIAAASDYATSHQVYALGARSGCGGSCPVVLGSSNGGANWAPVKAVGLKPSSFLVAGMVDGKSILVAGGEVPQISPDSGASFRNLSGPPGLIDAAAALHGHLDLLVSGTGDRPTLIELPEGSPQQLPYAGIHDPSAWFTPAWSDASSDLPAAFAVGTDPNTHFPLIANCSSHFMCSAPRVLAAGRLTVIRVIPSPDFLTDRTVFAVTTKGLYRSTDGGTTFLPITVAPPGPNSVIVSVQSLALSRDFHASASAGAGVAVAGIVAIQAPKGGTPSVSGGVYESRDGGLTWSQIGGPSALDMGVTAVAITPDGRVIAASLAGPGHPAQLACDSGAGWQAGCSSEEAVLSSRALAGGAVSRGSSAVGVASPGTEPLSGNSASANLRPRAAGSRRTGVSLGVGGLLPGFVALLVLVGTSAWFFWRRRRSNVTGNLP